MSLGQNPAARFFPQRNRIIAALSDGCLVIETAFKSSSLITASQAADRNVPVMVIPDSPLDPHSQGCNQLISGGTYLVQSVSEIISILSSPVIKSQDNLYQSDMFNDASDYKEVKTGKARNFIMKNISHTPIDIDELLNWCHVSAQEIYAAILELALARLIQRHYRNRISQILSV